MLMLEFFLPLDDIFINKSDTFYSVQSMKNAWDVFQAILASPPRNTIFLTQIERIVADTENGIALPYVGWLGEEIQRVTNERLRPGFIKNLEGDVDFYMFSQECMDKTSEDCRSLDRYGKCCFVYDGEKKIFKIALC